MIINENFGKIQLNLPFIIIAAAFNAVKGDTYFERSGRRQSRGVLLCKILESGDIANSQV